MSTGGPDPNRLTDADPEVARGELGDPGATRFGMPSWAILLLVVVIAALFLAVAIF